MIVQQHHNTNLLRQHNQSIINLLFCINYYLGGFNESLAWTHLTCGVSEASLLSFNTVKLVFFLPNLTQTHDEPDWLTGFRLILTSLILDDSFNEFKNEYINIFAHMNIGSLLFPDFFLCSCDLHTGFTKYTLIPLLSTSQVSITPFLL